jgi:putative hydrolase of the HAD superfamily
MIKSIIFDLGKVLIPFDFQRGFERFAPRCGYPAAELQERLRPHDLFNRFESGMIEPRAFVEEFSRVIGLNECTYEEFCEMWSSIFLPDPLIPEELLEALHRRYRLVLLSNTNALHFEMLERTYPLLRHFDEKILSHEVRAMKPSPLIYQAAVEAAQCKPEECFYTDDIPAYVEGARKFGIDAVQFQNSRQIEEELRARGVEW